MRIAPKDWREFQHYKERNPPWIRLQKKLLDSFEFHCLPVASRALAPMLWLIASDSVDGVIEASADKLAFRLRMSSSDVVNSLKPLIDKGFFILLQSDSEVLAPCLQDADSETEAETLQRAETETETETESEGAKRKASPSGSRLPIDWELPGEWKAWALQERPDLVPKSTAERFYDYWHGVAGAKGRKADWQATWRNWVRNEKVKPSNGQRPSRMTEVDRIEWDRLETERAKQLLFDGGPPDGFVDFEMTGVGYDQE